MVFAAGQSDLLLGPAAPLVVFLQPQDGGCVIKLSLQASFDLLFFLLQDKYITIKVGVA